VSERAIEFVEEWVSERINAQDYQPEGDNSRAEAFAAACLAAAKAEGISKLEIDDAFEDLTAFIAGEIQEASNREAARQAAKDG
jgi:5-enolpyruvylshikimate-3-phosphate synthase